MNRTAVLWIRVSSELQSHGYSLDSQEDLLTKAAEEFEVAETFRVTESAKTSERRKMFKEMIEFVKANKIGHLFAWSHDRLGRHYKDFATLQSLIDDNDVAIHLVESNKVISRDSPITDRFMFQVLAALAESDNRKRANDTKRGMHEKARQGGVPHLAPIGYLNVVDPTDTNPDPTRRRKIVVLDPDRAPLIVWMFEAFAKGGWSLSTMAEELNRRGLATRATAHRPPHPLDPNGVRAALINPFYIGKSRAGDEDYHGTYEPLTTEDVWSQVQGRLESNRMYSYPGTKRWFAFKPFLKCGYCGSGVSAYEAPGRPNNGKYVYYVCSGSRHRNDPDYFRRKFGTDHCPLKSWREEKIDELIEAEIGKLYVDDFLVEQVRERLRKMNNKEDASEARELRRLEAEKARRQRHLKLIYSDRLDEKITIEHYEEVRAETQAELDRIKAAMERLTHRNSKAKEQGSQILAILRDVKDVYHQVDLPGRRKLLEVMLAEVRLQQDPSFAWQYPFNALFSLGEYFRKNKVWAPKNGT
jgi:DNA invertase Pin-like site-specific DNA recombinase